MRARRLLPLLLALAAAIWQPVTVRVVHAQDGAQVEIEAVCAANEFFDTAALRCEDCDTYFSSDSRNMVGDPDDAGVDDYALSCTCDAGFRLVTASCATTNSFCAKYSCQECAAPQMPTADAETCLPCDPETSDYINSAARCICDDDTHVLVDHDAAGNRRDNITCLPCPDGTRVFSSAPFECRACADANQIVNAAGSCDCADGYDESGGVLDAGEVFCTPSDETRNLLRDYPQDAELVLTDLTVQVSSAVQEHYYLWAAVNCFYLREVADLQPCQTLANLCVLQHYNEGSPACNVMDELQRTRTPAVNGVSDWRHGLPWIFYNDPSASEVRVEQDIDLNFAYEDDARGGLAARTEFFLSAFSLEGDWQGMEALASQFWYGPGTAPSVVEDEIGNFGFNIEDSFELNLTSLIAAGEPSPFYELFLRTGADDDGAQYYPCPFRDLNYKEGEALLNTDTDQYTAPVPDNDVYHRRFTLYDIVGGLTASSSIEPEVVQFADTIILETAVYFQGTQPKIYPPEIAIHYTEVEVEAMQYCDPLEAQLAETVCDTHTVTIQIIYFPDDREMWTAVVVVAVFNIIAMIALFSFRLMNRNRTNLSESGESCTMDGTFFKFLVIYLAQSIAWIGAILPAMFALYFIVFFKLGPQPFSLLPSLSAYPSVSFVGADAYLSFKCAVYLSGVFDWIYIAHCVAHQCSVDVFFIDWEKPRGYLRQTAAHGSNARARRKRGSKKPTPVSAWRTIMMANEWCKLGTARKTSIELTLITLVFVMVGCDFQYIAVPRPNSLLREPGPKNILLDFGNNVVWFVIILAAQRMGNWALQRCFVDNPPILFVDLCTIAKVSVMVLDQNNRGYYLHCRSPYQFADGSLKDLLKQLAQEEENLTTARGLDDGTGTEGAGEGKGVSEACQTFEMYMTRKWRSTYDTLYKEAIEEHREAVNGDEGALTKNLKGARSIRRGKGDLPPEHLQEASTKISEFLRSFFDNSTEHRWKIGARTACGRNCDQGPPTESVASKSLLLPDDPITQVCGQRPRFERVLLYGIEAELNLFNIMTFCVLDLASQNKIAAAFGAYLFDLAVVMCRAHFGRKNVSAKTLIDEKFLF